MALTPPQRATLNQLKNEGRVTGVTSTYNLLKQQMGQNAPSKADVGTWMSDKPDLQPHRMPASHAGVKNAISPVIPHPPVPLSSCFADTFFLPSSIKQKRVYKACILYICSLTKFIHLEPATFGSQDRPFSTTARDGCIRFIEKVRQLSGMPALHMTKLRTDAGSEWAGDFAVWIAAQAAANRNFYSHSKTSGSRASGNSIAERAISSVRRLIAAHFRSIEAQWDAAGTPPRNRRYYWTDYLQEYEDRYNNRRHSTIRARPIDAVQGVPPYREQQMRIIVKAVRRYGTRAVDRYQPTKKLKGDPSPRNW